MAGLGSSTYCSQNPKTPQISRYNYLKLNGSKKAPAKDANKKKSAEEEAKAKADEVDDVFDAEYKKMLRLECRNLEKLIKKEEDLIGLYNDESDFVLITFGLLGRKN
jgi:hypothetical protein